MRPGADIIFAAAGASGLGVFDAAEEKKKFAIGVDANQNWTKPGLILTSMLKRVDEAVFTTIAEPRRASSPAGSNGSGWPTRAWTTPSTNTTRRY